MGKIGKSSGKIKISARDNRLTGQYQIVKQVGMVVTICQEPPNFPEAAI